MQSEALVTSFVFGINMRKKCNHHAQMLMSFCWPTTCTAASVDNIVARRAAQNKETIDRGGGESEYFPSERSPSPIGSTDLLRLHIHTPTNGMFIQHPYTRTKPNFHARNPFPSWVLSLCSFFLPFHNGGVVVWTRLLQYSCVASAVGWFALTFTIPKVQQEWN